MATVVLSLTEWLQLRQKLMSSAVCVRHCRTAFWYFEQIELQAKLLKYFLGSNESNINQITEARVVKIMKAQTYLQDLLPFQVLPKPFPREQANLHLLESFLLPTSLLAGFFGSRSPRILPPSFLRGDVRLWAS